MAVGFKFSNVLTFEVTEHDTIIITTRHIVYEMDVDDLEHAEEFQKVISSVIASKKKKLNNVQAPAQRRKTFYLEDSKIDRGSRNE